jgi:hypothetical protein
VDGAAAPVGEKQAKGEAMTDLRILDEIQAERDRQDAKWGGPEHDDRHSFGDWLHYLRKHVNKAVGEDADVFKRQMIRAAALAIAAIEATDRYVEKNRA